MMSFGGFDSSSEVPKVERKQTVIEWKQILEIPAPSEKYIFSGESKCGKSVSALTLGYLNKTYIDRFEEEGFKYIPYALKNGVIPEINEIYFIDSEAFLNQLGKPVERETIGDIFTTKVKYIGIPTPSKQEVASIAGVLTDPESIEKVQFAVDMYIAAIEMAVERATENTLIIVDSGSRLKWLLDSHADVVYTLKVKTGELSGNPATMPMEKYGPRNAQWLRLTTMLKQSKATVVMTLMMTETSQVVLDMKRNSKFPEKWKHVGPRKREWVEKGTEYNFDSEFAFDEDVEKKKYVQIGAIRALPKAEFEKHYLNTESNFSFLWAIEEKLKIEIGELK